MSYPVDLQNLYREILADSRFDHLRTWSGVKFVGGHGPLNPKLMLVGEAPGKMENARLIPFQGPAGINLTNLLEGVGIEIADCYITNAIKFWPWEWRDRKRRDGSTEKIRGTRTPTETEQRAAKDYLLREIDIVNPQFVGLCGRVPTQTLFPGKAQISVYAGTLIEDRYVPLFHPSLLGYSPQREPEIRAAYKKLASYLETKV